LKSHFTRQTVNPVDHAGNLKFISKPPIDQKAVITAMKILLVEDSRAIRLENERALVQAGYSVIWAEDGECALKLARKEIPDLILLDLMLPRISGIDVLRFLKRDPVTNGIPVVVVSGLSQKNRQMLMEAGADEYVEKSLIMPSKGINLLPRLLDGFFRRIQYKASPAPFHAALEKHPNR
jgi:CheY-like chemotaxis protein